MSRFDNLINLPRPESKHPKMSIRDRAAQFSPFAALSGHEDAINETARRVDRKIELSEEEKTILDQKTHLISENPDCEIEITYFVADKRKQGGAYVVASGIVIKIDTIERKIVMSGGEVISLDDVLEINGELFDKTFDF